VVVASQPGSAAGSQQQRHPFLLFPDQQAGIHVALGRDISPLDEADRDPLQAPLPALDHVVDGRPASVRPGVADGIPALEYLDHGGGHGVLRLIRIAAREDDVPDQRLVGVPEELAEGCPRPHGILPQDRPARRWACR
jgi:hypothetical protein